MRRTKRVYKLCRQISRLRSKVRDAVCSQNESKCDAEQITVEDEKEAVKNVTEDNARSRNIMVFENEDLEKSLSGLFKRLDE